MATARCRSKKGLWEARWYEDGKAMSAPGFATKKEAIHYGQEQEALFRKGIRTSLVHKRITLSEFVINHWSKTLTARKSTKMDYQRSLNSHILPYFGNIALVDIKPIDIETWKANLKLAPKTVEKHVNLLATILKKALENEYILKNPMKVIKRPKAHRLKKVEPLSRDSIDDLISVFPKSRRIIVELGFQSVGRPSEVLGVTIHDFDFEKRTLKIDKQISRFSNEVWASDGLKTSASYRTIGISQDLINKVKKHVSKFGLGPHGLLVKNRFGGVYRYKHAQRDFSIALSKIGLSKGIGLHVLRHSGISFLIEQDAHPKEIQRLAGHSSIQETMDTYGHLFPESTQKLADMHDRIAQEINQAKALELA
jgi:integrase